MHLLFQNDINDWFNIGYEAGVDWDGSSLAPDAFLAACFNFQVHDKVCCFVEPYGRLNREEKFHDGVKYDCSAELGVAYMVHPRVQLDLTTDVNFNHFRDYFLISAGVAWRIN